MKYVRPLVAALTLCCLCGLLSASGADADDRAAELLDSLNFQTGAIELANGVATLEVPAAFRYLDPKDTQRFLEEGWGNPDGSGTLGMLLPEEADPFSIEGWGVVISYREDGYVSDEDAEEIDYDDLLESMRDASREDNKERVSRGFAAVNLVGWAAPPRYDAATQKLYWAKELQFGDDPEHTLNYDVRILGRKGVLVMNAVSAISQLPKVSDAMGEVIAAAEFNDGYRYAEFDPGVDKVAAYGIAALIGGKIAAKAGLLAKLGGLLLVFKKFIVIGLAAVGGIFAKLFKGRKAES